MQFDSTPPLAYAFPVHVASDSWGASLLILNNMEERPTKPHQTLWTKSYESNQNLRTTSLRGVLNCQNLSHLTDIRSISGKRDSR